MTDVLALFSQPPMPTCSHTLRVPADDTRGIFQALVTILKAGMSVLYARDGVVDLTEISDADIEKLQEYFRSFCISLTIARSETFTPAPNPNPNRLKDYVLVLRMPGQVVTVSFDFLTPDTGVPRLA